MRRAAPTSGASQLNTAGVINKKIKKGLKAIKHTAIKQRV